MLFPLPVCPRCDIFFLLAGSSLSLRALSSISALLCPHHPHPDDYTGYYYGPDHPMKPQRIAMTHQLVLGYGLHRHMEVYVSAPPACTKSSALRPCVEDFCLCIPLTRPASVLPS